MGTSGLGISSGEFTGNVNQNKLTFKGLAAELLLIKIWKWKLFPVKVRLCFWVIIPVLKQI